jgi:DNA-binding Xre family transcriptional regulator
MSRHVRMQWNLRQVMADRGLFQTSELVPLLADRGIHVSREHVYRLVTRDPQRINVDILAALCDAFSCTLDDLMTPVVEETRAKTGTGGTGSSTRREGGPTLGAIRPIRARVRRPNDQ